MDLKDKIRNLSERTQKNKPGILTEEATKNAIVLPFLQALGYDVFDPSEVVPEYTTDIGTKKGEKIDYAIQFNNEPVIIIECKHWAQDVKLHNNQLIRYFAVSKAKFGILTNGLVYQFFSDLDETNKMDEAPFFEFNIEDFKDNQIEELKKFQRNEFDAAKITTTASELKYSLLIKEKLHEELNNPTPEFVKFITKQVYKGVQTSKVIEQFSMLIKRSANQYISDMITDRLKTALIKEDTTIKEQEAVVTLQQSEKEPKIETTEIEKEGFMIVKTILRQKLDADRITFRDSQSYFAIFLDDNNRKTICRLYLNGGKKYFSYIDYDDNKKEVKTEIQKLDDIFNFADILISVVEKLDIPSNKE